MKLANDASNPQVCGYGKKCTLPAKVQGICPPGWHLPSYDEWDALITALGGKSKPRGMIILQDGNASVSTVGEQSMWDSRALHSQTGWDNGINGTDAFGFSALPVCGRVSSGDFDRGGRCAAFWAATDTESEYNEYAAYAVGMNFGECYIHYYSKDVGFSVRCLRDSIDDGQETASSSASSKSSESSNKRSSASGYDVDEYIDNDNNYSNGSSAVVHVRSSSSSNSVVTSSADLSM